MRAFLMACVKFRPNFSLKSYFFYFVQSLFKTPSIRYSIFNSILFKYYLFINFLLLFSTQLKPNKHPKKNLQQLHQQSLAISAKKNSSKFTNFHRNITDNHSKFTNFHSNITENHQNQNNTSTSKQNHTQTITITDLKKKKKQQKKPKKKKKKKEKKERRQPSPSPI